MKSPRYSPAVGGGGGGAGRGFNTNFVCVEA